MKIPTNEWMNDSNVLAQIAHTLGGCLFVVLLGWLSGWRALYWATPLFVFYAAVKEFFYDANYELPKQTNRDNWTDFAFYMLGLALGLGIAFLKLGTPWTPR